METKTYSRARVAKANLAKILAAHEVEAEITTIEVEEGRFTAHAQFAPGYEIDPLLEEDLEGFSWSRPAAEVVAALAVEIDNMTAAEVLDEEIAEIREESEPAEVANPADVPLPRKSGYVNEVSEFGGVVAYCRSAIPELVAEGLSRKAVIEELRARGVAYGTARTQYQKWFASRKA